MASCMEACAKWSTFVTGASASARFCDARKWSAACYHLKMRQFLGAGALVLSLASAFAFAITVAACGDHHGLDTNTTVHSLAISPELATLNVPLGGSAT